MSSNKTGVNQLFAESISFRLYADHTNGKSVADLAVLCSRSESWVAERIEAARLCLEKQVRIVLPTPDPPVCPKHQWITQVWD
jgi:hypothetical protein